MGMFDTVSLRCPYCGATTEQQTKSGACTLGEYTIDTAPLDVMVGVLGNVKCDHCEFYFDVSLDTKPKFVVRKLEDAACPHCGGKVTKMPADEPYRDVCMQCEDCDSTFPVGYL